MPLKNPIINGNVFTASSAEIDFDGKQYFGIQSFSWDEELEQEVQYGNGSVGLGIGVGAYKVTGEFEMLLHEADMLLAHLGNGWMTRPWNAGVTYVEQPGAGVSSAKFIGARITKKSHAFQRGAAGIVKKFSFIVVVPIVENGITAVDTARSGIDAAVSGGIALVV